MQRTQEGRPVEKPARYSVAGQAAPSDLLISAEGSWASPPHARFSPAASP